MTLKRRDYIEIPKTDYIIAKRESHKDLTWNNTHHALGTSGLWMPPPALFMPYYKHVCDAADGKIVLHNGNHQEISKTEAEDHFEYLSTKAWSCLNALFEQDRDQLKMITYGLWTTNGKQEIYTITRSPLERCVQEAGLVDLTFNTQGLPTRKSQLSAFNKKKNLYFYQPEDGSVARFGAGSVGVSLVCDRLPGVSYAGLGVFACAKGARKK